MSNRRRHYRVRPDAADGVEIELVGPRVRTGPVRLLDLSAAGAGLELPADAHGALAPAEAVLLRVRSQRLRAPLELSGRVCHLDESRALPRVGMRFEDWRQHRALLDSELRSLFNERAAYRAAPAGGRRVRVELQTHRGRRTGLLRDLSVTGMGVTLGEQADVQPGDAVAIRLMLPRPFDVVVASGEVRYAQPSDRGPMLGLRLIADRREEARLEQDLAPWVRARQSEIARTGGRALA